ncbi:hypothetical protein BK133_15210 [Paenibacillus sp. FSL H8-0548]|uniref:hypothetical protein n=1 Tax=Paenibacillus sp. FSL H8-0548 TaxID=1920422 RepID=UPI00096BDBC9|nr:hypothetical protein [Paenibacillus sp. FSL H8-0548]OMF31754.1 hypothetical protein BK133_15210 [Paenibacillus sp. FSL H8-0548]
MDNEPRNEINTPPGNEPYASKPIFSNEHSDTIVVKKHSGLGIAAFIIGLISVVLLIIALVSGSSSVDQIVNSDLILADPNDTAAFQASIESLGEEVLVSVVLAVVCIFGAGFISFIGLILAIIAACSSKRRRLFGVIGIVLNVVVIVGGISLFIAGINAIAANFA